MTDRLKNLYLLIICFIYAVFHSRAVHRVVNPHKILILQMAKLGDMVCTTPMFRAVKKKYPEAKLYVVGNAINKEILRGNTDVDEYIVCDKNNFWDLVKYLRREKIDFACQTSPSFGFLATLYLAGIKSIATPKIEDGYCPWETKTYKLLRKLAILVPHRMGFYAPREYLRLLEPIGIYTSNTKKNLSFSKGAEEKIKNLFLDNQIKTEDLLVCISPAAGNKIKQWPPERFAKVADYIYKNYKANIFVLGAKNDRVEGLEMIQNLNQETKVISTLDKLNLDELKALISKMNMFISVDTGPIYIAEAFDVPTVDITGPIDEHEQPPIGPRNIVVAPRHRKKPELFVLNAKMYNTEEAIRQTESITVEDVISAIDSLNLNN